MGRKQATRENKKKQAAPEISSDAQCTSEEPSAEPSHGAIAAAYTLDLFSEGATAASMWFFLIAASTKSAEYAVQGLVIRLVVWSTGKVRASINATGLPDSVSIGVRLLILFVMMLSAYGYDMYAYDM